MTILWIKTNPSLKLFHLILDPCYASVSLISWFNVMVGAWEGRKGKLLRSECVEVITGRIGKPAASRETGNHTGS